MDEVLDRAHTRDPPRLLPHALDVLLALHDTTQEHHAIFGVTLTWPFGTPARRNSWLSTFCASVRSSGGSSGRRWALIVRRATPAACDSARRARMLARR